MVEFSIRLGHSLTLTAAAGEIAGPTVATTETTG
jgi:hypothetical protein